MSIPQKSAGLAHRRQDDLRLLVAIPALNEERTVRDVIVAVPRHIPGTRSVDILVVDDGSSDQTAQLATEAGALVIRHPRPGGVGSAFHSALAYALEGGFDAIVSIDADGQFDPRDIPSVAAPVISRQAEFSTASRFKDSDLTPKMPWLKRWGNRMMSHLISRLARQKFYDVSCGMRCYSRTAALHLHLVSGFTYTQEVMLNLAFKGLPMVEVPIRVRGEREFGESRVARSLWNYAWQTSKIIFRCYRDYHPLRFFGGLALALLLPAIGLGVFVSIHYLQTGSFSPHKWAGVGAISFLVLSLMMLFMGLIGDMLTRHRIYLEELLHRQRNQVGRMGDS